MLDPDFEAVAGLAGYNRRRVAHSAMTTRTAGAILATRQ